MCVCCWGGTFNDRLGGDLPIATAWIFVCFKLTADSASWGQWREEVWGGHNEVPTRVELKAGVLRRSFSRKRKHYFSHQGVDVSSRRSRCLGRVYIPP